MPHPRCMLARMRKNLGKALGLVVIGVGLAVGGIYIGYTDDAPGAALLGTVLAIVMVVLAVKTARRGSSPQRQPCHALPVPGRESL